jgi:DNA-binding transcriptional LysR family regulator
MAELRSVILTARMGSLGRAATALSITQPALSRRIAEIEARIGVQLFDRLARGVRPTDACRAFLRHAEIALASIDDALDAAKDAKLSRAREIAIGFLDVLCDEQLMDACRAAMSKFANTTVLFKSCANSQQVSAEVLTGQVKLGLRYRPPEDPEIEARWVKDDAIVIACAPTHPLARQRRASIKQLEREQWLGYPIPEGGSNKGFNETLALRGFGSWKTMALGSFHAQVKLLEGGFGLALLRRACIKTQLEQGRLVEIEAPVPVATPVYLTWRRNAYLGEIGEFIREQICAKQVVRKSRTR